MSALYKRNTYEVVNPDLDVGADDSVTLSPTERSSLAPESDISTSRYLVLDAAATRLRSSRRQAGEEIISDLLRAQYQVTRAFVPNRRISKIGVQVGRQRFIALFYKANTKPPCWRASIHSFTAY